MPKCQRPPCHCQVPPCLNPATCYSEVSFYTGDSNAPVIVVLGNPTCAAHIIPADQLRHPKLMSFVEFALYQMFGRQMPIDHTRTTIRALPFNEMHPAEGIALQLEDIYVITPAATRGAEVTH